MNSFLNDIIQDLNDSDHAISELIFIVPSKRAGLFLKRALMHFYKEETFIAPIILSIEEFISQLSGLRSIDAIETLFEFYEAYLSVDTKAPKESLETFSNWAQTLIQDFNEIDRYCIDHHSFFSYLSEIQDINHWYLQKEKTVLVQNYINFWENLLVYYTHFKESLLKKKKGYQGLLYRCAAEKIESYTAAATQQHILVGFNALNNAEQQIFQTLLEADKAEAYWDADQFFIEHEYHEASLFLRNFRAQWNYYKEQPFKWVQNHFSSEKEIHLVGVPKNVGQAKWVGTILSTIPTTALEKTALVLSDESLLLPMLNALPATIPTVNITMGLPLQEVPLTSFFEQLFKLHKAPNSRGLYYVTVLQILNSPPAYWLLGGIAYQIAQRISRENLVYLTAAKLQEFAETTSQKEAITLLFVTWRDASHAIAQSSAIITALKKCLDPTKHPLELEYVYRFYVVFNRLHTLQSTYNYLTTITTLYRLYKDVIKSESLDFRGEPFRGLQLMGMLESRCLDFETVIITSVNEGILPAGKSANSFIPYDLKSAYKLPTYREKDAIYTYHFYRLIQRAKKVYVLYNTEDEGVGGGEKSRFLHQLEIDRRPAHTIQQYIASTAIPSIPTTVMEIPKDTDVLQRIQELAMHGMSPSALATYIRNPLDFYYQYVLKIRETAQVEETIAANTLGTVIHNTLENFYKPLEGKMVSEAAIEKMMVRIPSEIKQQFHDEYTQLDITHGKNLLIFEVAKRYVYNFLKSEKALVASGAALRIIGVEHTLKAQVNVPSLNYPVYIKGKVDRIDELDGSIRIIDYKTGKVTKNEVIIKEWGLLTEEYTYSKVLQVLAYAYMQQQSGNLPTTFDAGIISFKNLKEGFIKFGIREGRKVNYGVTTEVLETYIQEIQKLIVEIATLDVPFTAKEV